MKKIHLKPISMAAACVALLGLGACNTGTDAGDTNTERSSIERTEETDTQSSSGRDTADYEHHYDHANHPDSMAIGDGAYNNDGNGNRDKRGQ